MKCECGCECKNGSGSSKHDMFYVIRSVQTVCCCFVYSFVYITCFEGKLRSFSFENSLQKVFDEWNSTNFCNIMTEEERRRFFVFYFDFKVEWQRYTTVEIRSVLLNQYIHHHFTQLWKHIHVIKRLVHSMKQTNQQRIQRDQIIYR